MSKFKEDLERIVLEKYKNSGYESVETKAAIASLIQCLVAEEKEQLLENEIIQFTKAIVNYICSKKNEYREEALMIADNIRADKTEYPEKTALLSRLDHNVDKYIDSIESLSEKLKKDIKHTMCGFSYMMILTDMLPYVLRNMIKYDYFNEEIVNNFDTNPQQQTTKDNYDEEYFNEDEVFSDQAILDMVIDQGIKI